MTAPNDALRFTDDDIQKLKLYPNSLFDVEALLHRLECAEKVCESCEIKMMEKHYDGDALLAWRKAKGETNVSEESAGREE